MGMQESYARNVFVNVEVALRSERRAHYLAPTARALSDHHDLVRKQKIVVVTSASREGEMLDDLIGFMVPLIVSGIP